MRSFRSSALPAITLSLCCNCRISESFLNSFHHWELLLRQDKDLDNIVDELQIDLLHFDYVHNALNMRVHDLLFLYQLQVRSCCTSFRSLLWVGSCLFLDLPSHLLPHASRGSSSLSVPAACDGTCLPSARFIVECRQHSSRAASALLCVVTVGQLEVPSSLSRACRVPPRRGFPLGTRVHSEPVVQARC